MGERIASFHNMMKYMVACCWQKMYRRMCKWQSKGFKHYLVSVSDNAIKSDPTGYMSTMTTRPPKRMDSALNKAIIDLHSTIAQDRRKIPGFSQPGLLKLAAACERVQSSKRDEQRRVYGQDTCVEFHQFLIAVLDGYRNALDEWNSLNEEAKNKPGGEKRQNANVKGRNEKANEKDATPVRSQRQCAIDIYNFGHLLWRIAYSQTLRDHLGLLEANEQIRTPTYAMYERGGYRTSASSKIGVDREAARTPLETDEEAQELQQLTERGGIALVFQRWIQLQVTQWAALDILSSYSHQAATTLQDADMSVSLLAMKGRSTHKMKNWRDMIKELVDEHIAETFLPSNHIAELQAETVIKIIEGHINLGNRPIFKKFRTDQPELHTQIHCEAALACFIKYPHRSQIPADAYKVVKVISPLTSIYPPI